MNEAYICEHCGAKVVEYKHGLSKGLLRGLYRLAKAGEGSHNIAKIGMRPNEWTNFQKLRYWGIVAKSDPDSLKGGDWHITQFGWMFLRGEISVPKFVWSYRGCFIRFEGECVRFDEVTDGYKYRAEYAEEARPHL